MKKRDIFWLNRILIIFLSGILLICISFYNIIQFNNSYIQEEQNELEIYSKHVEFVAASLLKNKNVDELKKYAAVFNKNKEFSFRIFDDNKNLIASTLNTENTNELENDERIKKKKYDIWNLYLASFHDKTLEKVSEIKIGNKRYYLEVALSQEFVISSIIKAQENVILFFCFVLFILILGLIHIFYSIRKSFNKLEDSVIQIAKGNFDVEIEQPKSYLLSELSFAITRMKNRLKMQIERLKNLEKYRSEFVSNMSHEIKTPITAINSAVELIEEQSSATPLQKECFDIIKSQTKSINNLVSDILSLSEIDLEKTNGYKNYEVFNLNNAVKEAVNNSAIGVNVEFNSEESFEVFGIESLVITAISNLLNNAIKYSNSEKIEVNLYRNKNIIIEVKDYGIGIAKEHLPRIFERFYRVDKNRSRQSGGTGLGLAIVKHIVELHNWEIEVLSEIGKGTSFKIFI